MAKVIPHKQGIRTHTTTAKSDPLPGGCSHPGGRSEESRYKQADPVEVDARANLSCGA